MYMYVHEPALSAEPQDIRSEYIGWEGTDVGDIVDAKLSVTNLQISKDCQQRSHVEG